MTRPPAFISAPFAAPTAREIRLNIARAAALGRLAVHHGYVSIVPHVAVALLFGGEDDPATRAQCLDLCLAHLEAAGRHSGARVYVLLRDDGTPSQGTALELEAWGARNTTMGTWSTWRDAFADAGEELLEHYNDPGAFWIAPLLRS